MKVSELFQEEQIQSSHFIEEKFDGNYWEGCFNFVNDNWHREIETMSPKQSSWLNKILEDCVEKRIEG